jgi:hypothetical protein
MNNPNNNDFDELDENVLALATEMALLKTELLARELLLACLVQRLGDNVVITKDDLRKLKFVVGDMEHIIKHQHSLCMKRTPSENKEAVTFSIITGSTGTKEKVM